MFNAQIKNIILCTLTATLIGTSMSPAMAGEGGGGGDRTGQTASIAPASNLPADANKSRPLKVAVVPIWEAIFFPGPMPGSRLNDR